MSGAWIYWPCKHGWRRWRDRLMGRRHPAYHGVYGSPTTDTTGSVLTIRWDSTGRAWVDTYEQR